MGVPCDDCKRTVRYCVHDANASTASESVLEEAQRLVHGDRGQDYGHPLDNHTTTAELFNAYLRRKYGPSLQADTYLAIDAEDVCWFNILQKCSRDANAPKRDNLVDVAGYAENVQMVRDERGRRDDDLSDSPEFRRTVLSRLGRGGDNDHSVAA